MINFVKNHDDVRTKIENKQKEKGLRSLASSVCTRWNSALESFNTVLKSEEILSSCFNGRDFINRAPSTKKNRLLLKDFINRPDFVATMKKAINILELINKYITMFQSDNVPLSEVYEGFEMLKDEWMQNPELTESEKIYLVRVTEERWNLIYGDGHATAYLLDPRYLGSRMTIVFKTEVENYLFHYLQDDNLTAEENARIFEQVETEYQTFKETICLLKDVHSTAFRALQKKKITPFNFWMSEFNICPLLRSIVIDGFE